MVFNKNFFHLALGFVFVVGLSLFFVLGVGFYESEIKNRANISDFSDEGSFDDKTKFVNKKDLVTNEWPPKPI